MNDRSLKILVLISSFVLVVLILTAGISALVAYYHQGSQALILKTNSSKIYHAKVNWHMEDALGRTMEIETKEKIAQDYQAALFHLQQYYREPRSQQYRDYFTEKSRVVVEMFAGHLQDKNLESHGTTYQHDLDLKLYHFNGSQVVFDDRRCSFKQIYLHDQLMVQNYDTLNYQVMMLLEDDTWRIRHQVMVPDSLSSPSLQPPVNNNDMVQVRNAKFYLNGLEFQNNGINYYPARHPWNEFWSAYDPLMIQQDFKAIKEMGLSVVRIFIPFHEFGEALVHEEYLQKLEDLLNQAQDQQIKVVVTLFDFFLQYTVEQWPQSDRHLEMILSRFRDHPAIFAWDLKNEPDLDFEVHGETSVINWLEFVAIRARQYDPNHLITIGWSDINFSKKLWERVDFSSAHFYQDPQKLAQYLQDNPFTDKPFVCGETGMHTYKSWWYPIGNDQEEQLTYYREILDLAQQYGFTYWAWTLYDFPKVPKQVAGKYPWNKKPQKHYGLIDANGNPKKAYHLIKRRNNYKISPKENAEKIN